MKKIIILMALYLIPLSVFNQEIEPTEYGKNEFGIHLGSTTGMGLSYRHWFSKTGFQLTAVPIISDDFYFVSAGLTFLQTFKHLKYMRFYGYLGNHFLYNTDSPWEYQYNVGIGPGFAFGKTVRFNLMVGYGAYNIMNEIGLFPCGEMGLYYSF